MHLILADRLNKPPPLHTLHTNGGTTHPNICLACQLQLRREELRHELWTGLRSGQLTSTSFYLGEETVGRNVVYNNK